MTCIDVSLRGHILAYVEKSDGAGTGTGQVMVVKATGRNVARKVVADAEGPVVPASGVLDQAVHFAVVRAGAEIADDEGTAIRHIAANFELVEDAGVGVRDTDIHVLRHKNIAAQIVAYRQKANLSRTRRFDQAVHVAIDRAGIEAADDDLAGVA